MLFLTPNLKTADKGKRKKLARVKTIVNVLYLVDPTRIFFHHAYGDNFTSNNTAHAQTKCQDKSTSGRGARASYRTRLLDIRPGDQSIKQLYLLFNKRKIQNGRFPQIALASLRNTTTTAKRKSQICIFDCEKQ